MDVHNCPVPERNSPTGPEPDSYIQSCHFIAHKGTIIFRRDDVPREKIKLT